MWKGDFYKHVFFDVDDSLRMCFSIKFPLQYFSSILKSIFAAPAQSRRHRKLVRKKIRPTYNFRAIDKATKFVLPGCAIKIFDHWLQIKLKLSNIIASFPVNTAQRAVKEKDEFHFQNFFD